MPRTLDDWRRDLDDNTDKSGDCWTWGGRRNEGGYGIVRGQRLAHRLAWQIANGGTEPSAFVLHRCNNRRCVNPDHLYLGTPKMNTADCMRSGRLTRPDAAASKRIKAIQRRQVRKEAWEDAQRIEPDELLEISSAWGIK